jgi:hypothetical protein
MKLSIILSLLGISIPSHAIASEDGSPPPLSSPIVHQEEFDDTNPLLRSFPSIPSSLDQEEETLTGEIRRLREVSQEIEERLRRDEKCTDEQAEETIVWDNEFLQLIEFNPQKTLESEPKAGTPTDDREIIDALLKELYAGSPLPETKINEDSSESAKASPVGNHITEIPK